MLKPLTEQTAKLLSKLKLSSNDRLSLRLSKEGEHFIADVYQQNSLGRAFPSNAAGNVFTARVPERKRLENAGTYAWQFAATDVTASIICAVWPPEQVIFTDEDARLTYEYLLLTCTQLYGNAESVAQYKEWEGLRRGAVSPSDGQAFLKATEHGQCVVPPHQYSLHPERPLAMYQQVGLHCSVVSAGYALFFEQGCGKTPVVIATVDNCAPAVATAEGRMYRAIVVAPKNVRMNWQSEFGNFSTVQGKVTVLRGGDMARTKLLIDAFTPRSGDQYSVVVCSYEVLVRDWDRILGAIEWDLAVLDEGHYIKWPKTKRAITAWKLRDKSKKRLILTGTPITNHPLDLYSELEFCERGASGFMSWEAFREFYGVWRPTNSGHKALVGLQNLPFLKERLAQRSFIITKEEALPGLPEKLYDVVEVEMSGEQADVYRQVATKLAAEIERDLSDGGNRQLTVTNVLTKLLRLAQITSGFVTWDEVWDEDVMTSPKTVDRFDPNPKIEAIVEDVKRHLAEDSTSKVVLWACWVQDIKTLTARFTLEGIDHVSFYGGTSDDDRATAEWRLNFDLTCRLFIGNPAAGGTGLNLLGHPPQGDVSECDMDVTLEGYVSQNWSSTARSQSEDRGHRRGTRRPVTCRDYCVPGTIDEEIRLRVMKKRSMALAVSDVREILKNVMRGIGGGSNDDEDE